MLGKNRCYGLNITPSPKIHMLKSYPQFSSIWRWKLERYLRSNEEGPNLMGSVSLQKAQETLERTLRKGHVRTW